MSNDLRARLSRWVGASPLRRMLANASMLFGAETVATLISLVQFPLVTRLLGPADYGTWGIAVSWVALIGQFLSFRLWETIIKYLSQFMAADDEPRALALIKLCLWIEVSVAVITLVVVTTTAGLAAGFILRSRPDGADLIRLESLDVFAGLSMAVWMAVLRTFNRFRSISIYNVGSAVAIFIGWMSMLYLHAGVGGLILTTATIKLGQTLTLALLARRDLEARFPGRWWRADLSVLRAQRREIWVMLFSMNIDTFRKIVLNNADLVVLGWFSTPTQAGLYRVAEQLATYANRLTNPLYDTLYPEVVRLYASGGRSAVAAMVGKLQRGVLAALAAGLAAVYIVSPFIIPRLFGGQFTPALPIFFILILANVWLLGLWVPAVMLAAGRAKHLTVLNTLSSLVMLVMLLVLVPFFGALGAAVAQTTFQFVWLALSYPVARRLLQTQPAAEGA